MIPQNSANANLSFLGHTDVATTEIYAWADAETKRRALAQGYSPVPPTSEQPYWGDDPRLMRWLRQLCSPARVRAVDASRRREVSCTACTTRAGPRATAVPAAPLRHTKAMHLVQANVNDVIYIRDLYGVAESAVESFGIWASDRPG